MHFIDPHLSGWLSERHLRLCVVAGRPIDAEALCASLADVIRAHCRDTVADVCHAGPILMVEFATMPRDHIRQLAAFLARVESLRVASDSPIDSATARTVEVPACYHESLALDLSTLAAEKRLEPRAVARMHLSAEYTVRFMGFSPGFAYMRGLPPELAAPRLLSPRPRVPPGSIAIADDQCGIYPHSTAGGWRLVARTPMALFDPARGEPSLLRPGDRVRFVEMTLDAFNAHARGPYE